MDDTHDLFINAYVRTATKCLNMALLRNELIGFTVTETSFTNVNRFLSCLTAVEYMNVECVVFYI